MKKTKFFNTISTSEARAIRASLYAKIDEIKREKKEFYNQRWFITEDKKRIASVQEELLRKHLELGEKITNLQINLSTCFTTQPSKDLISDTLVFEKSKNKNSVLYMLKIESLENEIKNTFGELEKVEFEMKKLSDFVDSFKDDLKFIDLRLKECDKQIKDIQNEIYKVIFTKEEVDSLITIIRNGSFEQASKATYLLCKNYERLFRGSHNSSRYCWVDYKDVEGEIFCKVYKEALLYTGYVRRGEFKGESIHFAKAISNWILNAWNRCDKAPHRKTHVEIVNETEKTIIDAVHVVEYTLELDSINPGANLLDEKSHDELFGKVLDMLMDKAGITNDQKKFVRLELDNYSQKDICDILHKDPKTLYNWKTKTCYPKMLEVARAENLGCEYLQSCMFLNVA